MKTREEFRNGVKLDKGKFAKPELDHGKTRSVWDKIARLEERGLCLECERHRWKTSAIQVCDECAKKLPSLKCCHCKMSYPNHKFCDKASSIYKREMCMSCASNWATHNCEPKLCRLCNQWSAWRSTSECDRCYDLLQKYGQPTQCESCNNNAAFDRGSASRQRVNGLRLCFLCTCNFKKNDYYNRKLMISMNMDAGSVEREYHNDKSTRSSRDSDALPAVSEKSSTIGSDAPNGRSVERELKTLKDLYNKLKKKYAELKEENVSLKKRLKTR
ncbi:Protein FAM76A [Babesia sp. Xinjiang]|uniref:Protein FAM76A n=1 Tax=Babesia sp. Xinjiang TaxID=462227 RepID=UPI000A22704F|nr:Protein FAM76A [Babesia sp. Xinjiang]ORM39599.1 Protein FAM76A [Babesia sp. Xinjiang]